MENTITFIDVVLWFKQYALWIIAFLGIFVEITPIKFNPISWLTGLLFKPIKKDMSDMKDELNNKIDSVKTDLKVEIDSIKSDQQKYNETINSLIKSNEMTEISRLRWEILEFSNTIDNGQLHTRDEYRHIKDDSKRYHDLIKKYGLDNGVIDEEMEKINAHYEEHKDSTSVYF